MTFRKPAGFLPVPCRTLPLVLLALALSGCSGTLGKAIENRVVVTADCAEVHTLSKWGPVGIGARVADSDAAVVSAAICNQALAEAVRRQQAGRP